MIVSKVLERNKTMKKLLSVVFVLAMFALCLASCGVTETTQFVGGGNLEAPKGLPTAEEAAAAGDTSADTAASSDAASTEEKAEEEDNKTDEDKDSQDKDADEKEER
jgi:hypothetical protein